MNPKIEAITRIGLGAIPRRVRRSRAWKGLSAEARAVLIAMSLKYQGGEANGSIVFDSDDGARLDLSQRETEVILLELEAAGFLASNPTGRMS